ncbi:hypothetical protein GGU10DRAFT_375562 [Lentinula aff. detonsa]|uniref:Uncharacterized protein n=1 Tax=Lentinula aff. detonsa TaxID=2804958 RepID=A0AA38KSD9_9AGAR|nr:hypothetical protein GGU10DRAFT_375562 [Lentinula aff. detonsa]
MVNAQWLPHHAWGRLDSTGTYHRQFFTWEAPSRGAHNLTLPESASTYGDLLTAKALFANGSEQPARWPYKIWRENNTTCPSNSWEEITFRPDAFKNSITFSIDLTHGSALDPWPENASKIRSLTVEHFPALINIPYVRDKIHSRLIKTVQRAIRDCTDRVNSVTRTITDVVDLINSFVVQCHSVVRAITDVDDEIKSLVVSVQLASEGMVMKCVRSISIRSEDEEEEEDIEEVEIYEVKRAQTQRMEVKRGVLMSWRTSRPPSSVPDMPTVIISESSSDTGALNTVISGDKGFLQPLPSLLVTQPSNVSLVSTTSTVSVDLDEFPLPPSLPPLPKPLPKTQAMDLPLMLVVPDADGPSSSDEQGGEEVDG